MISTQRQILESLNATKAIKSDPHVVIFHVNVDRENDIHPNADLRNKEYVALIDMLFQSVRLWHPNAKFSIQTSPSTNLAGVTVPFVRIDSDINVNFLMRERTNAQCTFVAQYNFRRPVVFIDSDMLINKPLDEIFDRNFDVGLTWRKNSRMPFNGGAIFLNNRRPEIAKTFMSRFGEIYSRDYANESDWFGDQLALRECVGLPFREIEAKEEVERNGCKFLLLSCDTYNYSPAPDGAKLDEPLVDKVIIHFKGARKHLMPLYWAAYLQPLTKRWWHLFLGQRKAERDAQNRLRHMAGAATAPDTESENAIGGEMH